MDISFGGGILMDSSKTVVCMSCSRVSLRSLFPSKLQRMSSFSSCPSSFEGFLLNLLLVVSDLDSLTSLPLVTVVTVVGVALARPPVLFVDEGLMLVPAMTSLRRLSPRLSREANIGSVDKTVRWAGELPMTTLLSLLS